MVQSIDGDVFGSTVNLASRLEETAINGQIVVSDAVKKELNSDEIGVEYLCQKRLKNISLPVDLYLATELET